MSAPDCLSLLVYKEKKKGKEKGSGHKERLSVTLEVREVVQTAVVESNRQTKRKRKSIPTSDENLFGAVLLTSVSLFG